MCELQAFQTEQVIFSSSPLVMKPTEEQDVITEASPTEAVWDYPHALEEMIRRLRRDPRRWYRTNKLPWPDDGGKDAG